MVDQGETAAVRYLIAESLKKYGKPAANKKSGKRKKDKTTETSLWVEER